MALQFHPPVHIIRPLDDVHTNCERDVQLICNGIDVDLENDLISDTTKDYSPIFLNPDEKNDGTLLPRRLTDMEYDTVPKSRSYSIPVGWSYSISVGLKVTPKGFEDLDQRVKDNERFLNYGPTTDTCLWNAFDFKRVSSQCALALTRINKIIDYPTMKYSNESESIKRAVISISIPLFSLILLAFGCMLVRELCSEEEDDDIKRDDQEVVESGGYEYQMLDESKSKMVAHIAVPLETV